MLNSSNIFQIASYISLFALLCCARAHDSKQLINDLKELGSTSTVLRFNCEIHNFQNMCILRIWCSRSSKTGWLIATPIRNMIPMPVAALNLLKPLNMSSQTKFDYQSISVHSFLGLSMDLRRVSTRPVGQVRSGPMSPAAAWGGRPGVLHGRHRWFHGKWGDCQAHRDDLQSITWYSHAELIE